MGGIWFAPVSSVQVVLHTRLALGFAAFAMGLFATALGLLLPASGRRIRDLLLCVLPPVLLYFPVFLSGPTIGTRTGVPPWLAMWSANLVVGVAGLAILVLAFRR